MIKHLWSILCKDATVDAGSNNLSIINVIENVQFAANVDKKEFEKNKGKPILAPLGLNLVSLFYRDSKKGDATVDYHLKVLDPKGTLLGEFNNTVEFKEGLNRMRNITRFDSVPLTDSGTYMFQIFVKDKDKLKQVSAIPVDVLFDVTISS